MPRLPRIVLGWLQETGQAPDGQNLRSRLLVFAHKMTEGLQGLGMRFRKALEFLKRRRRQRKPLEDVPEPVDPKSSLATGEWSQPIEMNDLERYIVRLTPLRRQAAELLIEYSEVQPGHFAHPFSPSIVLHASDLFAQKRQRPGFLHQA